MFFRRQVRWYGIPICLKISHSFLQSTELKALHCQWSRSRCFSGTLLLFWWSNRCWQFDLFSMPFINPAWISGISWSMYYWSPAWRILSITLLACEMTAILWCFEHSLALPFFWIGMKTDLFLSFGHCSVFQIFWYIECSTFTASSFRIWNSSAGISSPPLALFILMLPKTHLTLHSRMSGSRWVITPSCLSV